MKDPRQVVLRFGDSIRIGMGGDNSRLFHFEIIWPPSNTVHSQRVEWLKEKFVKQLRKSHWPVNMDNTPTPASRYESRIKTLGNDGVWLHRQIEEFGSVAFGEVHKTVNMQTGDYCAVKVMRRVGKEANDIAWRRNVLREVTTLQKLYHVSPCMPFVPELSLSPLPVLM
jgi:hypothetical protein